MRIDYNIFGETCEACKRKGLDALKAPFHLFWKSFMACINIRYLLPLLFIPEFLLKFPNARHFRGFSR